MQDGLGEQARRGGAGEVGHIIVQPARTPLLVRPRRLPGGGRRPARPAPRRRPGRNRDRDREPAIDPADPDAALEELVRRAENGAPGVLRLLTRTAVRVGAAAETIAAVLNPELLVLGGHFARLSPWLLPGVHETTAALRAVAAYQDLEVRPGRLGPEAAARGAALLVGEYILDNPTSTPVRPRDP
ncbi:ROK family protein [Embleya sp. NBC_00896]|uniref:ROK family protein n=1 Tax=Embleya sp. NBC_00896 TaxID=2975961 RepID=UPI002F91A5F1|nr:ROK family protein [Embleya sp. NBC_00896]